MSDHLQQTVAAATGYTCLPAVNLVGVPEPPATSNTWTHEEIAFSRLLQEISTHERNGIFTGHFYQRAVERARHLQVPLLGLTVADLLEAKSMADEDTRRYFALLQRIDNDILRRYEDGRAR